LVDNNSSKPLPVHKILFITRSEAIFIAIEI